MKRGIRYVRESEEYQLGFMRPVVAILIPLATLYYSAWLALALAVPCGIAFVWYVKRSIKRPRNPP